MSERISEIEARLAAATPGPIELTKYPDEGGRLSNEKRQLIADIYGAGNTAFYANARDDVAYLLAELRKRDEGEALAKAEALEESARMLEATASLSSYHDAENVTQTWLNAAANVRDRANNEAMRGKL